MFEPKQEIKQNTPEWLEMRKNHLGASDAPIIMKESPFKTPYRLWQEKLGLVDSVAQTSSMRRGHELEEEARNAYSARTGISTSTCVVFHPSIKYLMASLDGISSDKKNVVEIKNVCLEDHETAAAGKIPNKYYGQLQQQLSICSELFGIESIDYFSYNTSGSHIVKVFLDEKYIKKLYKEADIFWQRILNFDAPPMGERDFVDMSSNDEWQKAVLNLRAAKVLLEKQKLEEDKYRKILIDLSSGRNCAGNGVTVQKVIRKGMVNYAKIPELSKIDLEKYRGDDIETLRITVK
jgi:putative phage-type endonuclease